MWTYKYNKDTDETQIKYNDETIGIIDGKITSWTGQMPKGDAKEIVLDAVENPMTASLLYGFEKIREDADGMSDE